MTFAGSMFLPELLVAAAVSLLTADIPVVVLLGSFTIRPVVCVSASAWWLKFSTTQIGFLNGEKLTRVL
jgi:hypothetical protein